MCLDNPLLWLGNVPLVTFPAFSLLIIIFVFWTLTLNPFNSNAPFQASNITFKPSSISLTKAKSSEYSSSYGHSALISLDSSFSPMMNNEALNTDPCCKPSCTRKSTMKVPLTQYYFKLYYTLILQSQPTTLLHHFSSKLIIQHSIHHS